MGFFQKIFNKNRTETLQKTVGPKYLKVIKAVKYVYLKTILVDDEAIFTGKKAMVLGVVPDTDITKQTFHRVNKQCYQHINFITNLSYDDFANISGILNIKTKNYDERFTLWPSNISNQTYESLYNILKIDFVEEAFLPKTDDEKFVISINENFYLNSDWRHIKYCGLDTNAREFFPEEFIHDNFQDAIRYACVITNRLWATAPDNAHFFKQLIQREIEYSLPLSEHGEQLRLFNNFLKTNDFSGLGWEFKNHGISDIDDSNNRETSLSLVRQEYDRLSEKYSLEIDLLKSISSFINNPPFFINKIVR